MDVIIARVLFHTARPTHLHSHGSQLIREVYVWFEPGAQSITIYGKIG